MLEIFSRTSFDADLNGLADRDLINAFLDEVESSGDGRWQLTKRDGEWFTPRFTVKAIESLQRKGYNIYRIRPLTPGLGRYRILYAYDAEYDQFYLLAVVIKKPQITSTTNNPYHYDYEPTHPVTIRIRKEYVEIGIPLIC